MDSHVKVVGILFIVSGVLGMALGLFLFWVLAGAGILSGDSEAIAILSVIGTVLGGFIAILSIPEIIVGFVILKRQEWSRIAGIVLAILSLLEFPLGTIFGIYALWVLLNRDAIALFRVTPAPAAAP